MHENVMPWMLDKMLHFLEDEDVISFNTEDVVNGAFELAKMRH